MLFNSIEFLFVFLPVILVLALLLQYYGRGKYLYFISIASLVFYAYHIPENLAVILVSIGINFYIGNLLQKKASIYRLWTGIGFNLLLLGWFKYRGFFFGLNMNDAALPLAISFFTFQQIAYIVDIYKGRIQAFNFRDYIFCVTFFPHLIAGPIVKYNVIRKQIDYLRPFLTPKRIVMARMGLIWIILGLAKKVLLADTIAPYVDSVFDATYAPDTASAWLASLGFSLQIFLDFSAYSEIAVGLGLLLGIRLPINFNAPYRSTSIAEFWRRWHITLGEFLRNYLYIPLGGNRSGLIQAARNVVITMTIGGLWHGAGWNFILWGLAHGILISFSHGWSKYSSIKVPAFFTILITYFVVHMTWVLFRSTDLERSIEIYNAMFMISTTTVISHALPNSVVSIAMIIGVFMIIFGKPMKQAVRLQFFKSYWGSVILGVLFAITALTIPLSGNDNTFIYFQF